MAGNTLTLEFAGDASKLQKAAQQATKATDDVAASAKVTGESFAKASKESTSYTDKIGKLGAGVSGMSDAVDNAGAALQAMADIQSAGREQAARLARANADVEQAMIDGKQAAVDLRQAQQDLNQSQLDGKQSAIDLEQSEIDARQAKLDAATAQKAYNDAVKEYGPGSAEAAQAAIDLTQAQADLNQANLDAEQAQADAKQAQIDGTQATVDATQAVRDGKDAQLNLNDAMREANPTGLQQWADKLNMITPILSGLIGIVGLVTAAQWLWNAAQLANPLTWIVLGIVALIAIIVLLVKNWDWVKKVGASAWNWIKDAASSTWNFIKKIPGWIGTAFKAVANFITLPFRTAFNFVADAWNNTIGRLSFTFPGWVPGLGGATISVPNIPKFHTGGVVPGAPGSEMLALLQAGETVTPAGAGSDSVTVVVKLDREVLINATAKGVRKRGGSAQFVLGGVNA
jgi:hypothetical protein